ncbi:response regulator [Neptuniibacter sp. QD72_48]|uniref:response regulator n=1 Tax=unclassified Neptuniibacter TaxID=2630693 RepID=UPI0039F5B891
MSSEHRFSILLVIKQSSDLESLCNMVKRHFPRFYIANTEEEALSLIVEHKIDVLLMGLNTIQENEICYLHLLSAKKNIERILFKKIVFCSREDLKEAFSICNKDVFDDYFIVRPLYDPYHLLLRLRFIRRALHDQNSFGSDNFSVENLCEYFDQIISCNEDISDLNAESYDKLMHLVSFSMDRMKEKIIQEGGLHEDHHADMRSLFDQHKEQHIREVQLQQTSVKESLQAKVDRATNLTKQQKETLQASDTVVFDDSNILLLEDESEQRDQIKAILDSGGYKAQVSGCASHSLKLLQSWKPDIVLLDLTLPDMSALFVIDKIKQDPDMAHTRIMVLAKPGDTQNAQEAMKQGVHEVILKPIDRDMLLYKMGHNLQALKDQSK